MAEIFNYLAIGFMLWMCMDCIQRREHFVWIIIIILLPPVGAVAYFFAIKNAIASIGNYTVNPRLDAPAAPDKILMSIKNLKRKI